MSHSHRWEELGLEPSSLDPEFCGLFVAWLDLCFASTMCQLGFLEVEIKTMEYKV